LNGYLIRADIDNQMILLTLALIPPLVFNNQQRKSMVFLTITPGLFGLLTVVLDFQTKGFYEITSTQANLMSGFIYVISWIILFLCVNLFIRNIVGVYHDTTNDLLQKSLEQRESDLSQFAKGLAHEINNPLSAITMTNDILNRKISKYPNREINSDITNRFSRNADRIKNIVGQVAVLSGLNEKSTKEDINVLYFGNQIIEEVKNIYPNRLYTLDYDQSQNFPLIYANKKELRFILTTLLLNSVDATAGVEKGEITLKFRVEENKINIHVIDNGIGIEKQNESKIFAPFFTTKDPGKNSGLSLAISQKYASGNDAKIEY